MGVEAVWKAQGARLFQTVAVSPMFTSYQSYAFWTYVVVPLPIWFRIEWAMHMGEQYSKRANNNTVFVNF
eukprot:127166-Amphidinium_carterae.1